MAKGVKTHLEMEYIYIFSGMFTNIVARWPGCTHDSHVFRTSSMCTYLEANHHSLEDGILLGDSGYHPIPLRQQLHKNATTQPTQRQEWLWSKPLAGGREDSMSSILKSE